MPAPDFLSARESLNDEIASFIQHQTPGCNQGSNGAEPQKCIMTVTTKIISITPDDARRYLGNMVHNRPLTKSTVKGYAQEIAAGRWGLTGQGVIFDPKGRLLDGQHRMHAVIAAAKSIQTLAIYGVSPEMFSRMDGGDKRTTGDVLDVPNRYDVACAAKFVFREANGYAWSNGSVRITPMDGVAIVNRFPALIESVSAVRGMKPLSRFMSFSLAGYCHFRAGMESPERRDQFFDGFASGAGLGARSPVLALRNVLMPTIDGGIQANHRIAYLINAWRAHVDGRSMSYLRSPTSMPEWKVKL